MPPIETKKLNISINTNTVLTVLCSAVIGLLVWGNKQQQESNAKDVQLAIKSLQSDSDSKYATKQWVLEINSNVKRLSDKFDIYHIATLNAIDNLQSSVNNEKKSNP